VIHGGSTSLDRVRTDGFVERLASGPEASSLRCLPFENFFQFMGASNLTVDKPGLPGGRSYVLRTSMLEGALSEAAIECRVQLQYWQPPSGGSILQAFYWVDHASPADDRVYVRAGTVASQQRRLAAEQLSLTGLPAFIAWLAGILALPRNSPELYAKPFFDAVFDGESLRVVSRPERQWHRTT
jgi:hypothetical protein